MRDAQARMTTERGSRVGLAVLVTACLLPHLLRMAGPCASYADGIYPHAMAMLVRGHAPYTDFTQVAMLPAEALLALAIAVFGPSTLLLEAAQNLVILGTALALRCALRRVGLPRAGAAAALLWSWSLWVVHFNLFERETWAAAGLATALAVLAPGLRDGQGAALSWRTAWAAAAGLALAFAVKITALFPILALLLWLAASGRGQPARRLSLATAACAGGLVALHAAAFGRPFLEQVFVFGLFKGRTHAFPDGLALVAAHADLTLLAGLAGLLLWAPRHWRALPGAAAALLVGAAVFAAVLSPTVWDHNLIDLAAPSALLGGGLIDRLLPRRSADSPAPRRTFLLAGTAAVAVALLLVAAQIPGGWMGHARAAYGPAGPGFGGLLRADIARQADFVARHSQPDELVITTDPWISFLADRIEFVRYWDTAPLMLGLERSLAADGLRASLAKRTSAIVLDAGLPPPPPRIDRLSSYAARLLGNALVHVRPMLLEGLSERRIGLVCWPFVPGLGQQLLLAEEELQAAGYVRFRDGELAGYRLAEGRSEPRVEALYGPAGRAAPR